MSDTDDTVRSLFKGSSVLFLGVVFELGVSFVAKLLIARYLGKFDYGVLSIGITVMAVVSTLALVGLDQGVGRYLPRYDDTGRQRGLLLSALQFGIPISVLAAVAVYLAAPWLAVDVIGNPKLTFVLRVFAATIPLAAAMKLAVGGIRGMQLSVPRVYVVNFALPLVRFGGLAVVVALALATEMAAVAYLVAYLAAAVVGGYYLVRRTPLLAGARPTYMRRELLSFSLPLVVTSAMAVVFVDIDLFMLGWLTESTGQAGVYGVVYPLAQLLLATLAAVGFIFMPVISELHADGQTEEMSRLYQVVVKWMFTVTFPLFLVMALFPQWAIGLTFGFEYAEGAAALAVLAVGFFTHVIAGPNGDTLTSLGETRLIMYDNALVAAVNLVANFLLIPRYGFLGAAVATAIAYGLLNLLYSVQLYRRTGVQPLSGALVRPALVGGATMLVLYVVTRELFDLTPLLLVASLGVFGVVYVLAILQFGIEREEVMLVLSFEERFGVDLGPLKRVASWFM